MAETITTLTAKLDRANAAYEKLLLGEAVVEFQDSNGEKIRYAQASAPKLAALISNYERRIAILQGTPSSVKPMRVWL
jgi:hypothetical protein